LLEAKKRRRSSTEVSSKRLYELRKLTQALNVDSMRELLHKETSYKALFADVLDASFA